MLLRAAAATILAHFGCATIFRAPRTALHPQTYPLTGTYSQTRRCLRYFKPNPARFKTFCSKLTFVDPPQKRHARESSESLNSINIYIDTTWTTARLEQVLCPLIEGKETETFKVSITYTDYYELIPESFDPLVVPECFWRLTQLEEVVMQMVLLTGSNQEPDPLVRLPSTLRSITLQYSRLVNPKVSGSTFKMNWNAFFASKPELRALELNHLSIEAPMPTLIPSALTAFEVPENLISGTIPADLLSNYPASSSIRLSFAKNKLSGSVPSALFANFQGAALTFDVSSNALLGTFPRFSRTAIDYVRLNFGSNRLSGTIPSDLLNYNLWGAPQAFVSLDNNLFTGTIPGDLFSAANTVDTHIYLNFAGNALNGSMPNFFANISSSFKLNSWSFDLSRNQLTGPINNNIWPPTSLGAAFVEALYESNRISGTIPATLFEAADPKIREFRLNLGSNLLTGSILPSLLENAPFEDFRLASMVLANNSLTGPLTPQLIGSGGRAVTFVLDISSNPIGGTIPADLFSSYLPADDGTTKLTVSIGNCGLVGTLPSLTTSNLGTLTLNAENNALSAIPTSSWASYLTIPDESTDLELNFAHNNFTGELFLPNKDPLNSLMSLNVYGNDFTSLIIGANSAYIIDLNVGMNTRLTGSIPKSLFSEGSYRELTLIANHTTLTGEFPEPVRGLYGLDVSNTSIDFCGSNWTSPWDYILFFCSLQHTNAGNCISKYPPPCQYGFNHTQLVPGVPSSSPAVPSSGVPSSVPIGDNPSAPNDAPSAEHSLIFCGLTGLVLLFLSI